MSSTRPGGFRPASTRQPFRPTTRQVPPRKAAAQPKQQEEQPVISSDDDDDSDIDEDVENRIPQRMLASIEEASSPTPSPKKAASPKAVLLSSPAQTCPSPFKAKQMTPVCASPAPSSSSQRNSSSRPSSSAGTAFSDMETDVEADEGPSNAVASSSALPSSSSARFDSESDDDGEEDHDRTRTQFSRNTARASSSSSSPPPRVFFGTPSSSEKEQRRRYSTRVRERRLLRRDSLELARRKTLTLEEVEEAARAVREERERKAREEEQAAASSEDRVEGPIEASTEEDTQEPATPIETSRRPSTPRLQLDADRQKDAMAQREDVPSPSGASSPPEESAAAERPASHEESAAMALASAVDNHLQAHEPAEAPIVDVDSSATQEPIEAQSPAAVVAPAFDETLALESLEERLTPAKRPLPLNTRAPVAPPFDETVAFDQIEDEAERAAEVTLQAPDLFDQTLSLGVMEGAAAKTPEQPSHFDETLALDRTEEDAEEGRQQQTPAFDSPVIDEQPQVASASQRSQNPVVYALPSFDETLALDVLEDTAEDDVAAAYEEDFASGTIVRSISLPCKGFLDETLALEDLEGWETEEVEICEVGEEGESAQLDEGAVEEKPETLEQPSTAAVPTLESTTEKAPLDGEAAAEEPAHQEGPEQPLTEDQPALNAGVASASASFMLDSPGVGLARAGREGTPTLAVLAEMRQQATGSAVRRLFPHIPNDYHEILGKTDGTPAPSRSPAMKVTPLGEKDTNASWNTRAVRLTPTPSKQPSTPRSHAKRLQTPVTEAKEADEAAAHPFSPDMDRLRAARDAILAAAPPSPDKSPKKAARVAIPSPMKKSGDGEPCATEVDENPSPVKSPMGSFGRTINFWQALKQPGEEGVGSNAVPLPTSPLKASASPSKSRAGTQEELVKGPASAQKQPSKPSGPSVKPATTTTRLPKPATAAAPTSRLTKPKPVSSGIRPPSSVAAKPQAAVATASAPASTASIRKPLSSRLPMQSSARPTSADSASSSSSSAAAAKDSAAMAKLKDPRRPVKAEGTTSVRRAPISALRKLQATSDGNPFAPKSSLPTTADGGIDWLASSGERTVPGRASPEKLAPTMAAPSPRKPSPPMEAAAPTQLSSTSPSRLKINLSPVKLARSAGPGGAARARRVPVGSREATHAPEPATAAAAAPPTSSLRSSKSSNGSSSSSSASSARPAPHVNFHATTPILQRSAGASRKLAASSGSSSSSSPDRPAAPSSTRERSSSSSNSSSKATQRSSTREAADSEGADPFGSSSSSERAGPSKRSASASVPPKQSSSTSASSGAPSSSSSTPFAGPRASRVGKADPVPSVPISSAALDALTTRNSRKNEAYYAKLDVVVVRVDGPRPPSPSSKIRKSASASAGARRMGKEQAARARADRAKKRAAGEGEGEDEEGEENAANMSAAKALALGQHRLGAGEADVYATPPKVRAGAKGVRWHKALYAGPSEAPREQIAQGGAVGDYDEVFARRGAHRLRGAGPPRLVARDYGLDRHGNVRMALEAPPSPRWTRVKVTIRKIIYEDDDEESEEESGEEGEAW